MIRKAPNQDIVVVQSQTKYKGVGMGGSGDTDFGYWTFNSMTGTLNEYLVLGTSYNDYAGKFDIYPDGDYAYVFQNAHPEMSESSYVIGVISPNGMKMSNRISHGIYIEDLVTDTDNAYVEGYRRETNSLLHQGVVIQFKRNNDSVTQSVEFGEVDRDQRLNKLHVKDGRGVAVGIAHGCQGVVEADAQRGGLGRT